MGGLTGFAYPPRGEVLGALTWHAPDWSWSGASWAKLHRLVLDELGCRGEPDWSDARRTPGRCRAGAGPGVVPPCLPRRRRRAPVTARSRSRWP
ncbi:hypothetical protein DIZ27_31765 [Streptomyces sp. NWU339]|nr:hypothetical protein DIZ27_31765 [Streptomyces sp. NWU339]